VLPHCVAEARKKLPSKTEVFSVTFYRRSMIIDDMINILNLEIIQDCDRAKNFSNAYTSDLLSDVMGNAQDECVIITIQAHKNTIAVATLKDSPAVIICNNRTIPQEMIDAAKDECIGIFRSDKNQFEISGILYSAMV
jgi:hypothetical protein